MRQVALTLLGISLLWGTCAAQTWQQDWEIRSTTYSGVTTTHSWDWDQGTNRYVETIRQIPWTDPYSIQGEGWINGSSLDVLTCSVDIEGQVTFHLHYRGPGPTPTSVCLKTGVEGGLAGVPDQFSTGDFYGTVNIGIAPPLTYHDLGNHMFHPAATVRVAVNPVDGTASCSVPISVFGQYVGTAMGTSYCSSYLDWWILPPDAPAFQIQQVDFTSAATGVSAWEADFEHEGQNEPVRGWRMVGGQSEAFPVLQPFSHPPTAALTCTAGIVDLPFHVTGSAIDFNYPPVAAQSAVDPVVVPLTGHTDSQNYLHVRTYNWDTLWTASFDDGGYPSQTTDTGGETMYFTYGTPLNGEIATKRRLDWAIGIANGATDEASIADSVWNALGDHDPPLEPPWAVPGNPPLAPYGHEWGMLDSTGSGSYRYSGECDEQARLMRRALNMLGVAAADGLVFASRDADGGDVTHLKYKYFGLRPAFLFMNFGGDHPWNQFEGVCRAAATVYAVWPRSKSDSMLHMLNQQLQPGQYWIFVKGVTGPLSNSDPVFESPEFDGLADPNPVPLPGG